MKHILSIILFSTYLLSVEYGTAKNETLFNQLSINENQSKINLMQDIERDIYTQLKKISSAQKSISDINALELNISKLDRSKLDDSKKTQLDMMIADLIKRERSLNISIDESREVIKTLEALKIKFISNKGE